MNAQAMPVDIAPEPMVELFTEEHSPVRKKNLAKAVLLSAIEDYRGVCESKHLDAQRFLYPLTAECRADFDLVVSMTMEWNREWCRERLDRLRETWDEERRRRLWRLRHRLARCSR